jgi:hypothetical protein
MKKAITLSAISFMVVMSSIISNPVKAQDYKNAIGLRGGFSSGLTFKHFIKETAALEAILALYPHAMNVTLLYEKHAYAFGTKEFRWFYGAGGHFGAFNGYAYRDQYFHDRYDRDKYGYYDGYDPNFNYNRNFFNIGIDAILGLEYKITEIPFTIGVDLKPYIDLIYFGNNYVDGALSVRYYW